MGEKSDKKRSFILDKAEEVFERKGFMLVSMKDIVDACDISRGGLYLYFNSTEELLLEVLKRKEEKEDNDNVFVGAMEKRATSSDILALFLQEQKKELLNNSDSLTKATYEYFFAHTYKKSENPLKQQFDAAVTIIKKLVEDGVKAGEFFCEDPMGYAYNIMYTLEGIRVMSQTIGMTEKEINKSILYMMTQLLPR